MGRTAVMGDLITTKLVNNEHLDVAIHGHSGTGSYPLGAIIGLEWNFSWYCFPRHSDLALISQVALSAKDGAQKVKGWWLVRGYSSLSGSSAKPDPVQQPH